MKKINRKLMLFVTAATISQTVTNGADGFLDLSELGSSFQTEVSETSDCVKGSLNSSFALEALSDPTPEELQDAGEEYLERNDIVSAADCYRRSATHPEATPADIRLAALSFNELAERSNKEIGNSYNNEAISWLLSLANHSDADPNDLERALEIIMMFKGCDPNRGFLEGDVQFLLGFRSLCVAHSNHKKSIPGYQASALRYLGRLN